MPDLARRLAVARGDELADAPVDLSTARRLIGAGCPRQTAIRILL